MTPLELAPGLVLETTDTQVLVRVRVPGGGGYSVPLTELRARVLRAALSGWLAAREVAARGPGSGSVSDG